MASPRPDNDVCFGPFYVALFSLVSILPTRARLAPRPMRWRSLAVVYYARFNLFLYLYHFTCLNFISITFMYSLFFFTIFVCSYFRSWSLLSFGAHPLRFSNFPHFIWSTSLYISWRFLSLSPVFPDFFAVLTKSFAISSSLSKLPYPFFFLDEFP